VLVSAAEPEPAARPGAIVIPEHAPVAPHAQRLSDSTVASDHRPSPSPPPTGHSRSSSVSSAGASDAVSATSDAVSCVAGADDSLDVSAAGTPFYTPAGSPGPLHAANAEALEAALDKQLPEFIGEDDAEEEEEDVGNETDLCEDELEEEDLPAAPARLRYTHNKLLEFQRINTAAPDKESWHHFIKDICCGQWTPEVVIQAYNALPTKVPQEWDRRVQPTTSRHLPPGRGPHTPSGRRGNMSGSGAGSGRGSQQLKGGRAGGNILSPAGS